MTDVSDVVATALDRTFRELTKFQRTSFVRLLAELVECKPTLSALKEFAAKSPDKWAQAMSIMAGLAGFTKDSGATVNIYNFDRMSDVELVARIAELERTSPGRLGEPSAGNRLQSAADLPVIDFEPAETESPAPVPQSYPEHTKIPSFLHTSGERVANAKSRQEDVSRNEVAASGGGPAAEVSTNRSEATTSGADSKHSADKVAANEAANRQ